MSPKLEFLARLTHEMSNPSKRKCVALWHIETHCSPRPSIAKHSPLRSRLSIPTILQCRRTARVLYLMRAGIFVPELRCHCGQTRLCLSLFSSPNFAVALAAAPSHCAPCCPREVASVSHRSVERPRSRYRSQVVVTCFVLVRSVSVSRYCTS
ncbi:hypothetical protein BJ912DRAFT_1143908, partial [Pholiota molesta]